MRSRQEIKAYAKQAFAAQRSNSILAVLLVLLIPFALGLFSTIPSYMTSYSLTSRTPDMAMLNTALAFSTVIGLLAIPLSLLILVLTVNLCGTMVKVYYGQPITAGEPYSTLKFNFGRKLGGMCWEALWLYLWTLVGMFTLFIPTIIKALSYSQTQYILASNPNVTATNALKLSMRMTKGHKGKIFVLYLSFIGWQILNGLTFGILGIFYVNPYMYTTFAGFFIELRNLSVASGAIHPYELDGGQQQYSQPQYPPPPGASPYGQQPPQPQYPPPPPGAPPYSAPQYGQQPPQPQYPPPPPGASLYGQQPQQPQYPQQPPPPGASPYSTPVPQPQQPFEPVQMPQQPPLPEMPTQSDQVVPESEVPQEAPPPASEERNEEN